MFLRARAKLAVALLTLLMGTAVSQSAMAGSYGGYSPSRSHHGYSKSYSIYRAPSRYHRSRHGHSGHKYGGYRGYGHRSHHGYSSKYRGGRYGYKGGRRYYGR